MRKVLSKIISFVRCVVYTLVVGTIVSAAGFMAILGIVLVLVDALYDCTTDDDYTYIQAFKDNLTGYFTELSDSIKLNFQDEEI